MSADLMPSRVQMKLRGQRFEAQRDVLLQNATFFADFFADRVVRFPEEAANGTDGPVPLEVNGVAFTYERKKPEVAPVEGSLSGHTVSTASDMFDFGAMPNEHFGALIVSMRKGRATFRYDELGFEQQKLVSDHVRFFGVKMLADVCKAPPAPPPAIRGESDDDLEMPEFGCEYCGTTEHPTASCPRKDNLLLAAQTIAIANAQAAGAPVPPGCEGALARAVLAAQSRDAADLQREADEIAAAERAAQTGQPLP
jgi:hypothetical protein